MVAQSCISPQVCQPSLPSFPVSNIVPNSPSTPILLHGNSHSSSSSSISPLSSSYTSEQNNSLPISPSQSAPPSQSQSPTQVVVGQSISQPSHPMITRAKSGIFKPKNFAVSKPIYELHATPLSISKAIADVDWRKAMVDEFQALMRNNSWDLVPAIENQHVVSNKWVYKVKYKVVEALTSTKQGW